MSKKDAYWFKHDSTSGRGLRIKKLQHIYDHWGKGVYWDVIEVLREQENYMFQSDQSSLQMLAELIAVKDVEKFMKWYSSCLELKLFKELTGCFYSETLIENMKKWETQKNNGDKGGRPPKNKISIKIPIQDEKLKGLPNWFRLKNDPYKMAISEYIKDHMPEFLNVWHMQNKHIPMETILNEMDKTCCGKAFSDNDHIQNTFKKIAKELPLRKNSNQITVASTPKPFPKEK